MKSALMRFLTFFCGHQSLVVYSEVTMTDSTATDTSKRRGRPRLIQDPQSIGVVFPSATLTRLEKYDTPRSQLIRDLVDEALDAREKAVAN